MKNDELLIFSDVEGFRHVSCKSLDQYAKLYHNLMIDTYRSVAKKHIVDNIIVIYSAKICWCKYKRVNGDRFRIISRYDIPDDAKYIYIMWGDDRYYEIGFNEVEVYEKASKRTNGVINVVKVSASYCNPHSDLFEASEFLKNIDRADARKCYNELMRYVLYERYQIDRFGNRLEGEMHLRNGDEYLVNFSDYMNPETYGAISSEEYPCFWSRYDSACPEINFPYISTNIYNIHADEA